MNKRRPIRVSQTATVDLASQRVGRDIGAKPGQLGLGCRQGEKAGQLGHHDRADFA
jgi:hypothetical protein